MLRYKLATTSDKGFSWNMLTQLTIAMIGFSIVSCFLLLGVYWFIFKAFEKTWISKVACTSLLLSLALIQWHHWQWLTHLFTNKPYLFSNQIYIALLLISAPSFYLFSREILQFNAPNRPTLLLHFLPLALSPWLNGSVAISLSFIIGGGYALWLCLIIFRLREQRQYFRVELASFVGFAAIALLILIIGLLSPWLGERWFVLAYSNLTGVAILAMLYLQLRFPDITQKTSEAVAASYAASTLKNADCNALVEKIKSLLDQQKIYRDENLSLAALADELGLSGHQTSELINTYFNVGFSRLIRQYRVDEAKAQLINEPKSSVLSIGLAVGFTSQSNFYSAFRELTGETPGQFRKRMGIIEPEAQKK
ncbi:MAG: AraC family transcriptional regulator [Moraxellaceae bacterium]|nr:MAG: AraC family transcriptional regulator [Moraxellaceae bacterium]